MVKVAHITTVDQSLKYLLLNQLEHIRAEGFEVVGISAPGAEARALEEKGIRYIAVPMTRRFTPFRDLVSLWKLFTVMRSEKFTIVHTHTPKPGLLGQVAARLAGTPVVVNTIHGFYFHEHMPLLPRLFYMTLERVAGLCSHGILTQSREDLTTAVSKRICPPWKVSHLGNGIDLKRFDPDAVDRRTVDRLREELRLDTSDFVIGFVGRLVAEKGLLELFQAARAVAATHPRLKLLIIGRRDEEKADSLNESIAAAYGLERACVFTGLRQDMPELYSLMNVFVLPSHREGVPRSPMEACAMGVPCIVSDIRGCREVIQDGVNGLLVPPKDAVSLAQAIRRLMDDPAERDRLSANARPVALDSFDERVVFNRVTALYRRLLDGLPAKAEQRVEEALT